MAASSCIKKLKLILMSLSARPVRVVKIITMDKLDYLTKAQQLIDDGQY